MAVTCKQCRRTNPAEAAFCHFDGEPLAAGKVRPLDAGAAPFSTPFRFPSGRACRNFDELAQGCLHEPDVAWQCLGNGLLEAFLTGQKRLDLAAAARRAARAPEKHRGLDLFLDRLPTRAAPPAKLHVEPLFLNLGQMQVGEDHAFELHLTNQGARFLHGTLAVDGVGWLALGPRPGVPEKAFVCEHELDIPVLVRGDRLAAGKAPLQGRILIESNGGAAEVVIKVEVPPRPFPDGVLAGALTPRQLAEQAFRHAPEAGPYFENGAVALWYAANGWVYPVQGPPASGLAALQQYFEACGLTEPPRLFVEPPRLEWQAASGERVEGVLRVQTGDKKPVYAHAVSDHDWLAPQPAKLAGAVATIPLVVARAPYTTQDRTLTATVTVTGNGRQKFKVPVTLRVKPALAFGETEPPPVAALAEGPPDLFAGPPAAPPRPPAGASPWLHLLPACLLLLVLLGLLWVDATRPAETASVGTPEAAPGESDPTPYLKVEFNESYPHRFGLSVAAGPEKGKRLTFDATGGTNNTCLRLDGVEVLFAHDYGQAVERRSARQPVEFQLRLDRQVARGWRSAWEYPDIGVRVTQEVSVRPSQQSGRLETCLVRYKIENRDAKPHQAGLRFLLDTFIGGNDGVPFTVPGQGGLCDTLRVFDSPDQVPDFIQALERPDLANPGTVAHVSLKVGKLEPPTRVQLGAWPAPELGLAGAFGQMTRWHVPQASMKEGLRHDSAVVLYWDDQELRPGQVREVGFAYGLGQVASSTGQGGGQVALTLDGAFRPGGTFTVTAYVSHAAPDQTVTLTLPEGLSLVGDQPATQPVPVGGGPITPVSWKVRADRQGEFEVAVRSGEAAQRQTVRITARSFLD